MSVTLGGEIAGKLPEYPAIKPGDRWLLVFTQHFVLQGGWRAKYA